MVFQIVYTIVIFYPFYSSPWSCTINQNRARNLSVLLLWTAFAQQALLPVPARRILYKNSNIFLLPIWTVSARQGPLPGQVFLYRYRTSTHNPVLVNPQSFMEVLKKSSPYIMLIIDTMQCSTL